MSDELPCKGLYEHYKGNRYILLHVARHSEEPEQRMVVYVSCTDGKVWIRPLESWMELVRGSDGWAKPRFKFVTGESHVG